MNLKNIFSKVNRRLSNIERYNNTPRIKNENVAEHSYFVAFYVMMLADLVLEIDKERAMCLALIHDVEESISGDIPHNIKLKYPEMNKSLEKMNLLIAKDIFEDGDYLELWKETREHETLESKLVLFCDILSGYMYTKDEIKMGNTFMEYINSKQKEFLLGELSKEKRFKGIEEKINEEKWF